MGRKNRDNTYLRGHFNNSRKDKSTNQFAHLRTSGFKYYDKKAKTYKIRKVNTDLQPQVNEDYTSLEKFFKDIHNLEYTCAGLNSYEREVLIIDCDDTDYGKGTREKLEKYGIEWDYQKIKSSNGHSQTGIWLDKPVMIYSSYYDGAEGRVVEEHYPEVHDMYKRVYNYLNFIANGDLMYTGFNCQNPYFEAEYTHTEWNTKKKERHTLEWYDQKLKSIVSSAEFLKAHEEAYAQKKKPVRKLQKAKELIEETFVKGKDETDEEFDQRKREAYAVEVIAIEKQGNKSVNYTILQEVQRAMKYCLEHNTPFTLRMATSRVDYLYHRAEAMSAKFAAEKNYDKARAFDMFEGYTLDEALSRAMNDYHQLIQGKLKKTDLSKIGYNPLQRNLSEEVRNIKMMTKAVRVLDIAKSGDLSERQISAKYEELYGEPIHKTTVRRYLHEYKLPDWVSTSRFEPFMCREAALTYNYAHLVNDFNDARNHLYGLHIKHVDPNYVPYYVVDYGWAVSEDDFFDAGIDAPVVPRLNYTCSLDAEGHDVYTPVYVKPNHSADDAEYARLHHYETGTEIVDGLSLSDDFRLVSNNSNDLIDYTIKQSYHSSDNTNHTFLLVSLPLISYNNKWTSFFNNSKCFVKRIE